MKVRTLFLLLVFGAIAGFAALNWSTFMASTTLSLGVAEIQAPLGLVMLAVLVFITAIFLVYVVYLQTTVLLDARSHARELKANRELADQAEASRFTELRNFLEQAQKQQASVDTEVKSVLLTRIDQLEQALRLSIEQSGTTLSAYIGELEDRLEKNAIIAQNPPTS